MSVPGIPMCRTKRRSMSSLAVFHGLVLTVGAQETVDVVSFKVHGAGPYTAQYDQPPMER